MLLQLDDLKTGLERAAVISVLTWRRAGPDDPLDDGERYGWWGDSFPTVTDDRIGSRLYLLRRRTLTADTERTALDYVREALQWLIDDGHVGRAVVTGSRRVDRFDVLVELFTPDGARVPVAFDNLWQVINAVQ
ncbi:phage GP46 family protein [Pseudomonas sp. zfem005]|nr:phage GP46 family protein [Pseudomonas sp. zfem005]MDU9415226.1 phage GP46 family protein [Pseudomonas sp. zfem005]